jgi:hypothetical protein
MLGENWERVSKGEQPERLEPLERLEQLEASEAVERRERARAVLRLNVWNDLKACSISMRDLRLTSPLDCKNPARYI